MRVVVYYHCYIFLTRRSIAGVEMEQIQGLMETCGVDLDFSGALEDQIGAASDYIANEYAKSGTQICDMMFTIAGSGWEEKCGLVNVVANDGSCEWVLPEAVEEFVVNGALMLDGGDPHVGEERGAKRGARKAGQRRTNVTLFT